LAGFSEGTLTTTQGYASIQIPHWPVSAGYENPFQNENVLFKFLIGRFQRKPKPSQKVNPPYSNSSLAGFSCSIRQLSSSSNAIQIPHWPVSAQCQPGNSDHGYQFKFLIGRFQRWVVCKQDKTSTDSNSSLAGFSASFRDGTTTRIPIQIPHWPVSAELNIRIGFEDDEFKFLIGRFQRKAGSKSTRWKKNSNSSLAGFSVPTHG